MSAIDAFETSEVKSEEFKRVMRRFVASVSIITSAHAGRLNGMTATAVCSVAADPPSLLIIVNRESRSYPIIEKGGVFTVNLLGAHQEWMAAHFASKAPDPFATVPHRIGRNGCPIINWVDAHVECGVTSRVDSGTHTIFVGNVIATDVSPTMPLLYHDGAYRQLAEKQTRVIPVF